MLKALFQIEAKRSGVTVALTIEPGDDGTLALSLPGGVARFTVAADDLAAVLAAIEPAKPAVKAAPAKAKAPHLAAPNAQR